MLEAPIISVDGEMVHADEYEEMIVAYRNGTPVRIQDIGRAIRTFKTIKFLVNMSMQMALSRRFSWPYKRSPQPILLLLQMASISYWMS